MKASTGACSAIAAFCGGNGSWVVLVLGYYLEKLQGWFWCFGLCVGLEKCWEDGAFNWCLEWLRVWDGLASLRGVVVDAAAFSENMAASLGHLYAFVCLERRM